MQCKRFFLLIFTWFFITSNFFAQNFLSDDIVQTLQTAENAIKSGDLDKAYSQINQALQSSKRSDSDVIPTNVIVLARTIYRAKIKNLLDEVDDEDLKEFKENLFRYPEIKTVEIEKLVKQVETNELLRNKEDIDENLESLSENQLSQILEETRKAREASEQTQKDIQETLALAQKNRTSIRHILIYIIITISLILIIILVVLVAISSNANRAKKEQLKIRTISVKDDKETNEDGFIDIGISTIYAWSKNSLPPPEETPEEKEELRNLATKCERLGEKIDKITNRKNNSKNVSELVYKLALKLGVNQHEALIFFCAGMVYDAGILGVSPEILNAKTLSRKQRNTLNRHVELYEDYLEFVPRRYWQTFSDAAHFHHENMDGSGFPEGLEGDEIPEIARIIRVADSYIALTSRRSYREGTDKEAAFSLLEERTSIYDETVLSALHEII